MDIYEPIKNYETYGINRLGEIKDYRTGKPVGKHVTDQGYWKTNLRNPNGCRPFLIHRLVAIQFIQNPDNNLEVDHIDRNKNNNNVNNLRWADDFLQSQNRSGSANSIIKHKYITYEKNNKFHCHRYRIQITKNKVKILNKSFGCNKNTLQNVIDFRNKFCQEHGIPIID